MPDQSALKARTVVYKSEITLRNIQSRYLLFDCFLLGVIGLAWFFFR